MQERVFVGRQGELAELNDYLEKALAGLGQVCFVAGQAGSGKTALVRQFVQQALAVHRRSWLAPCISPCASGHSARHRSKEPPRWPARGIAWFSEGFDAPDLREARKLLEELAPS